ncbi:hypothetical protein GN244_ATG07102 [Phytophthora infestans]|uniref:Uncharacterized protein n=1 Tax=Phytophthora infestans TaxID=4787 RepID=A0A833WWZ5_PHYIN|nr:hypothetical protein GN244_ATG07102 [Phytophthora infestans]
MSPPGLYRQQHVTPGYLDMGEMFRSTTKHDELRNDDFDYRYNTALGWTYMCEFYGCDDVSWIRYVKG